MPCLMARSRKSSPPIIRRLPSWSIIFRRSPASVPAATISPISTTFAAMSAPRTSFACRCRVKMPIRRSKRCAAKPSRSFCRPARSNQSWQTGRGCYRNLVLMHEIIGHGSGTYDTSKYGKTDDPVSVLGRLGSALEEQRADLTALVFVDDPKLVEIGACKDATEAKLFRQLTYDMYLGDFLLRLSRDRTLAEMHQRGHWLFINKLLNAGAIQWVARDGGTMTPENQVLAVVDYDQFQNVARAVLGELQAIKANREEKQLKALFSEYAPLSAIEQPWAQAVIRRGQHLAINAGYVEQPWRVTAEGKYEMLGGSTLESIAPFWKP